MILSLETRKWGLEALARGHSTSHGGDVSAKSATLGWACEKG